MNDLPNDLKSLETCLRQLTPRSGLDADHLIYRAGYEAVLAQKPKQSRSLKMFASALIGAAAMWGGMMLSRPAGTNGSLTKTSDLQVVVDVGRANQETLIPQTTTRPTVNFANKIEAPLDRPWSTRGFREDARWIGHSGRQSSASGPTRIPQEPEPGITNLHWQRSLLNQKTKHDTNEVI